MKGAAALCWTLTWLLWLGSCEKCRDCTHSKLNDTERAVIYDGRNQIAYSNGRDTALVQVERQLSEPDNTECAAWPLRPSCGTLGWAKLNGDTGPLLFVHRISIAKTDNTLQCNEFQIGDGNGFLLNCNDRFELSPAINNRYDIRVISNYVFNQSNIGNVQEVLKPQILGNVSELTRAVYHPEFGVIELTYSNPSDTWKQIP